MKVQNSNFIPVNHFTKNDLIKDEINARQEEIKLTKEVVTNNEKQIQAHEKQKDLILAQIERNEKHIGNMDKHIGNMDKLNAEVRAGLEELAPFKAYCEEQLGIKSSDAYDAVKSINCLTDSLSVVKKVNETYSRVTENLANIKGNTNPPIRNNETHTNNTIQDNEFIKNVRELGSALYKNAVNWSPNTTPFVESFKDEYTNLMHNRGVLNQKIRDNEQSIYEQRQILQNYTKAISGSVVGSRVEENEIDKIVSGIFKLKKEINEYIARGSALTNAYMESINSQKIALPNILDDEPNAVIATKDLGDTLREGDLMLELGSPRKALTEYNKLLVDRDNEPVAQKYSPIEEKLRQASKLYTSFQPMIDKLNITDALKLNLYCSSIAAHTHGIFALSKAEVLHMINSQFFYPPE